MRSAAIAVLLALVSAAPLGASGQALGRVRDLLGATRAITIFDHVTAAEQDGSIRLDGKVTSASKREQIESEVATVPGVQQIVNRIGVLSSSASDEALRQRIAKAVYGHPTLRAYAAMSHPPIRILVDRGRVTLAGSVRSAVERQVAVALAEDAAGSPVDDQLRISAS